ncbi:MAG: hypothetical protein Q9169_004782 [Polycauliona sp. 2 TL-2023]
MHSTLTIKDSVVELGKDNEMASHASFGAMEGSETSNKILDIIFEYSLNKFSDTTDRLLAGRPKFLSVIEQFLITGSPVKMCLPAFPFKSANKVHKVLGTLPDKAEELALDRLDTMCARIQDIYPPGAKLTIISDGLVYNDLLGISDRDTWAYGEAFRHMAIRKGLKNIDFSRLKDLVAFPLPEKLDEITYVANATNFRRYLFNAYGKADLDMDYEIANNPDTQLTYLGYRRFLESDLKYIFPLNAGRSNRGYKNGVRYLAKEMLIRGYAFAAAVKVAFPQYLRLSIHQSTGEHKISMSLLNTKTGFTTPWHCSVALMADGEWMSAPMGDFRNDPKFELVHHDGQPSHFKEKGPNLGAPNDDEQSTEIQGIPKALVVRMPKDLLTTEAMHEKHGHAVVEQVKPHSDTSGSFQLDESEKEKAMGLPGLISQLNWSTEHGESIDPLLNPKSANFSFRDWLKTIMSVMSADPEKYPTRVAGVAYRNLSAEGFGETTDYQGTFGNYPWRLMTWARWLITDREKPRIQILKDLDGLVKSGEMLVVLGRPGRFEDFWTGRISLLTFVVVALPF